MRRGVGVMEDDLRFLFLYWIMRIILCVPFVETEQEIFLKTAYKNRKLNKTMR